MKYFDIITFYLVNMLVISNVLKDFWEADFSERGTELFHVKLRTKVSINDH